MNKKQKILAIFTLSLVLFLLLGNTGKIYAAATSTSDSSNPLLTGLDIVGGIAAVPLSLTIIGISLIAGSLASIAVQIGGFLSNFALSLNSAVLQNPLIDVGWKITRDLANLGFVLFIIIIAIATILRFQEYGAKNTLGKLIAVALLVNFSLVFAGVFIDFSNMLTNFFISNITGAGVGGLGTSLAAAFNVGQFLNVKNAGDFLGKIATFSGAVKICAGLVFAVVFTLLVALCLIAVAAMFLLRYLNLSVLLVLAPLACLFIILPATESMWKEWWKNFMKWIIFAPVASFFFYLAVYLANNYKTFTGGISLDAQGVGKMNDLMGFGGTPMNDFAGSVINLVIVGGFLISGLIISDKMGIGGAKTFLNMASTAGKWARGAIGRGAAGLAIRPLRGEWGQKIAGNMQKSKFMPINRLGAALGSIGVEQSARLAKAAEGRINKQFTSDKSLAMGLPTLSREKQIAAVQRLTKNKTINLVDERVLNSMIGNKDTENVFKRHGAEKTYTDFEKAAGRNTEMVQAKTPEARAAAAKKFHDAFSAKDYDSIRTKSFTKDAEFIDANIIGMLHANPGALSKIIPKLEGGDLKQFSQRLGKVFDQEIDGYIKDTFKNITDIGSQIGINAEKKLEFLKNNGAADHDKYKLAFEARTKNLLRRGMGFEEYPPVAETTI